jgi:hypothetical protein
MKKLFFTILCCLCVAIAFPQYMTLKGNQLHDSTGAPFYVKGVNYDVDLYNTTVSLSGAVLKPGAYYYETTRPTYYQDSASIKDIGADFRFIRDSLGCNTIRLCVANAVVWSCSDNFFNVMVRTGNGSTAGWVTPVTSLDFIAPYYKALLDTAAACHVKIVLLLWSKGAQCDGNSTLQSIYGDYLQYTAVYLKNEKALLAYDTWNEPEFCGNQDKGTVCTTSGTRYGILKGYDPNHLITVGMWGPDVYNYGIDVYAADFYAVHLYYNTNKRWHYLPNSTNFVVDSVLDYNNIGVYKDRFNTFARLMQNASGRPWMVGEASSGANLYPDNNYAHRDSTNYYKKADGDTGTQAAYLTNLYTVVKQLGGMGCTWWCFMDGRPNTNDFNPEDPADNFFGLLSNNRKIKPAGYALKNFNPNTVTGAGPAYPSDFQNLLSQRGDSVIGVVTSSGVGVHDAFVTGWHRDSLSAAWQDNIPTGDEGNFTIHSQTPGFGQQLSTTKINVIQVGAAGYNIGACDGSGHLSSNIYPGKHYEITKATSYDSTNTGLHLSPNTNNGYIYGADVLTLQDFHITASTGGTIYTYTAMAGNEIAILPQSTTDSYVAQTAEAAIYNAYYGSNCDDPVWSSYNADRKAHTGTGKPPVKAGSTAELTTEQPVSNAKTVYLSPDGFLMQVYPNPATDMVLLQSAKSINLVMLCNMYGATVAQYNLQGATQQSININTLTPGTYIIKILYTDNTTSYTQIIKQ